MNNIFKQVADPDDEELLMGRHAAGEYRRGAGERIAWTSGKYRLAVIVNTLKLLDLGALLGAGYAAQMFSVGSASALSSENWLFIYLSALVTIVSVHVAEGYHVRSLRSLAVLSAALLAGGLAALSLILLCAYLSGTLRIYSAAWLGSGAAAAAGLLFMNRVIVARVIRQASKADKLTESVVIVGANDHARKMLEAIGAAHEANVRVLGIFDDRVHREIPDVLRPQMLGSTDHLLDFIRRSRVDRVVLAMPWIASDRIDALLTKLRTVPVRIDLVPSDAIWKFPVAHMEHLGSVPILNVVNGRVDEQCGMLKRMEDLVISGLLLALLSPLLLLIALAIKLDSRGPVIFKQRRHGFNNEVFEVYKFRSMTVADCGATGIVQATRHDKRVTRLGALLRRSSLDELPQLLNVLLGNMSIVGPRPHAVQHNIEYGSVISEYFARHNVKPGITGWAQVNGLRGETDTLDKMHRRVDYDLEYIERWSLSFDLKILLKTVFVVWFDRNAY
jgi:Undecaprenyl-phosphate glucose phosphotransferase